jgi:hypothetical protein
VLVGHRRGKKKKQIGISHAQEGIQEGGVQRRAGSQLSMAVVGHSSCSVGCDMPYCLLQDFFVKYNVMRVQSVAPFVFVFAHISRSSAV